MARDTERIRIAEAASAAAKIVADAAATALETVAKAALAAQTIPTLNLTDIKNDISEIKVMLDNKYVTKDQFQPIKLLVYGLVSLILVAVVGALLTLVILKKD